MTRQIVVGDRRYYRPEVAFIPLEFADAAYRYGHGQIRHRYLLQHGAAAVPVFPDLLGFQPVAPRHWVDWTLVFDAPGSAPAQRARKLDGRLVGSLISLPVAITGACEVEELSSLAVRDLERGEGVGLPSGESIARHFGERPLSADEVGTVRRRSGTTSCVRPMCEPAGAVSVRSEAASSARYSSVCWSSTRARYVTPRSRGRHRRHSPNSSLGSITEAYQATRRK